MAEADPLRVLIADDEPLAAERLQLLLARAEGAQLVGTASDGDSAINLTAALASRPAAARHRHAGPRRDRRRAGARRAEALAGGRVRDGLRPVRGRRVRGRSGRLSDEAGRSRPAPARARPRARLPAAAQRPAGAGQGRRNGWRNSGRRTCPAWCGSPRATSTASRPSAITCGCTSAAAAG